jgi:hypothetical protein
MADVAETIEHSGRRIGRHAWVEMRLFETLGGWSGTVPDPRARAMLARQSHHHAWHAELWHDLLPALPHLPRSEMVVPDETDAEVVATLNSLDASDPDAASDDATAARLTAAYHLALPHLIATYTDHLEHTTVITDAPTTRVLRLILADLADDRAAGDDLITDLSAGSVRSA